MNPENGFDADEQAKCQENVAGFIPRAMRALTAGIEMNLNEICRDWFDNICS